MPPAVEVFRCNRWTEREVPAHVLLSHLRFFGITDELYIYSFNKVKKKEVQVINKLKIGMGKEIIIGLKNK